MSWHPALRLHRNHPCAEPQDEIGPIAHVGADVETRSARAGRTADRNRAHVARVDARRVSESAATLPQHPPYVKTPVRESAHGFARPRPESLALGGTYRGALDGADRAHPEQLCRPARLPVFRTLVAQVRPNGGCGASAPTGGLPMPARPS